MVGFIKALNGLSSNGLSAGQKLILSMFYVQVKDKVALLPTEDIAGRLYNAKKISAEKFRGLKMPDMQWLDLVGQNIRPIVNMAGGAALFVIGGSLDAAQFLLAVPTFGGSVALVPVTSVAAGGLMASGTAIFFAGESELIHNAKSSKSTKGASKSATQTKSSISDEALKWLNSNSADNTVYYGIKNGEAQYTGITTGTCKAIVSA